MLLAALTDEQTLGVLRDLMETILKIMKRRVIIIAMRICESWTSKKLAYELSSPYVEVGGPQAGNNSSNPPEYFHKNVFIQTTL